MKSAYFHAVEDGLVTANPLQRMSKLCKGAQSPDEHVQPLTAQEVENTTQQTKPRLYAVLLCAVRPGLRRGELIGPQWVT